MRPLAAFVRTGVGRSLLVSIVLSAACGRDPDDLYPNSRLLLRRWYSAHLMETAGLSQASISEISRWYDARFAGAHVVEETTSPVVRKKRWRLQDREVEVFVVDHGRNRSVYVRELWGP
jgi:hypothetical protein